MENSLFDKTFKDSEGNVALVQAPNLPLLVWLAATLLKLVITSGSIYIGLDAIAFGTLFTWAWQELFQGVNYFRRALGLVVLMLVIASKISGIVN
jgi:hypothetical protein